MGVVLQHERPSRAELTDLAQSVTLIGHNLSRGSHPFRRRITDLPALDCGVQRHHRAAARERAIRSAAGVSEVVGDDGGVLGSCGEAQ